MSVSVWQEIWSEPRLTREMSMLWSSTTTCLGLRLRVQNQGFGGGVSWSSTTTWWGGGLRVQGPGFRFQGLGFRVWGSGFGVWGLGVGVWG